MAQKFSKLMVWHTWKSFSQVSFRDHQVWLTKARLRRSHQVWHLCWYLFFTFLGGFGTVASESGASMVMSYSRNNGGTSIFCLKTCLWTFKLFCPLLMYTSTFMFHRALPEYCDVLVECPSWFQVKLSVVGSFLWNRGSMTYKNGVWVGWYQYQVPA